MESLADFTPTIFREPCRNVDANNVTIKCSSSTYNLSFFDYWHWHYIERKSNISVNFYIHFVLTENSIDSLHGVNESGLRNVSLIHRYAGKNFHSLEFIFRSLSHIVLCVCRTMTPKHSFPLNNITYCLSENHWKLFQHPLGEVSLKAHYGNLLQLHPFYCSLILNTNLTYTILRKTAIKSGHFRSNS